MRLGFLGAVTAAACLCSGLSACEFGPLPPLNQFDPDAPDNVQAPVLIQGRVDRDGANIEQLDVRLSVGAQSDEVLSRTDTTETGAFGLSGPARGTHLQFREFGCTIHAEPLGALAPGQEIDLGVVYIDQVSGDLAVKGRVSTGGALPGDEGITVELYRTEGEGAAPVCTELVAETVTQLDGVFTFGNLPGGFYAAAAKAPGMTVDVSAGQELPCDYAGDDFFFDLSISSATGRLTVSSTDPAAPEGITRTERVVFAADEAFDWADTVELSEDATFGGFSEVLPFSSTDPVTYPSEEGAMLATVGQTAIYAQFSSSCGDSPLYAAPVLVDPEPPLLVSYQIGAANVLSQQDDVPAAVIADASPAAAIALDALDASGVNLVIERVELVPTGPGLPDDEVRTVVFDQTLTAADSFVSVRDVLVIPPEEGTYRFESVVTDLAGNAAFYLDGLGGEVAVYAFDVIRDSAAPRTPLPAVTDMDLTDDVALVWLDEYECGLICEQNPGDNPFFVRGGPAYPDFANVAGPPFVVPVFTDGETEIEIRAVDAAGNASPGIGRVTVRQQRDRTVLDVPVDRVLRRGHRPSMTAGGGTLLAMFEPHHALADPLQDASVLVSQPLISESVGTDVATSSRPELLRKLNLETDTDFFGDVEYNQSQRTAGGLAYGAGMVHWVEWTPSLYTPLGRQNFATFDANGTMPIAPINAFFTGLDPEGLPAPTYDNDNQGLALLESQSCRQAGPVRCLTTDTWRAHFDKAHLAAAATPSRGFVVGGTAGQLLRTVDETEVETRTITGPAFIGTRMGSDVPRALSTWRVAVNAPPGERAGSGIFEVSNDGLTYNRNRPTSEPIYADVLLSGGGYETFHDYSNQFTRGAVGDVILGMIVPEGMTVEFPVVPWTNDEVGGVPTGITPTTDSVWLNGLVQLDLTGETAPYSSLDATVIDGATEPGLALKFEAALVSPHYEYAQRFNGMTLTRMADAREPAPAPVVNLLADDAATSVHSLSRGVERRTDFVLATASDDNLVVPAESCRVSLRVDQPVAVRDIRFNGNGLMDEAALRLFRRPLWAGALGAYAPASPFYETLHQSFSQGQNLGFDPEEYDFEGGIFACDDINAGEVLTQQFNVTVPSTIISESTATAGAAPPVQTAAGTAFASDFFPVPDAMTVTPYPVTPGEAVEVYMIQYTGDSDMYVRLGAAPTLADYDCRPFGFADESCSFVIPPGVTELYVAMAGFAASSDYQVEVRHLVEVGEVTATPDERLVILSSADENHHLVALPDTGAGYPVGRFTPFDNECAYFWDLNHACSIFMPSDVVSYKVWMNQQVPTATGTFTFRTQYAQTQLTQVGSIPVAAGQNVSIVGSSGPGRLRAGFETPVDAGNSTCLENLDEANPDPCEILVASDQPNVYIAIEGDILEGTYTVDVSVTETGCTSVRGNGFDEDSGESEAVRILEPGYYLMSLGSYGNPANWPTAAPAIYTGPPTAGAGPVEVLGSPVSPSYFIGADYVDDRFDVPAIDDTSPVCNVQLSLGTAPIITRVAGSDEFIAGAYRTVAPDGSMTESLRLTSVTEVHNQAPGVDASVPLDDDETAWALHIDGDRLMALVANRDGGFARLLAMDLIDGALVPVAEECLSINDAPTFLQLTDAVFDGLTLTVGGQGVSGGELRVYAPEEEPAVGACRSWSTRRVKTYPGEEVQGVAQQAGDAFAFVDSPAGQRAVHHELRRSGPLYPGGARGVLGYDVSGSVAVLALYNSAQGNGDLEVLDMSSTFSSTSLDLAADRVATHPVLAGPGRLATLLHDANGGGDSSLVVGSVVPPFAPVTLTNANVTQLPDFEPTAPASVSEDALLATDGRFLALVAGNAVQVFDLGLAGLPAAGLAPALEDTLSSPSPKTVVMRGGALLVTYADRSADLWLFDDANGGVELRQFDGVDRRAVGLTNNGVILLEVPVTVQSGRTAMFFDVTEASFAALIIGDVTGQRIGTLPSGAYFHRFLGVSVADNDDLYFHDVSSPLPVLWRLDARSGRSQPVDGSLRPLTSAEDSALNGVKVDGGWAYYVKARGLGYALYRMELK